MQVLFTSDSHFHHVRIIEYCAKSRGQFRKSDGFYADALPDPDAMNKELVSRWNSVVGPDDVVYHLGDFAFKLKSKDPAEILQQLHGHKRLIPGNHDLLKGKRDEVTRQFWLSKGFESVNYSLRLELDGVKLFLHHEPMPWKDWEDCDLHLCGHVHDNWATGTVRDPSRLLDPGVEPQEKRVINVGVDVQDLVPRLLPKLLEMPRGKPLPDGEFADGILSRRPSSPSGT